MEKSFLKFELVDNKNKNEFNESTEMKKSFYGSDSGEVLSIEDYYTYCKEFAAAMGFCEKTINEWFGEY